MNDPMIATWVANDCKFANRKMYSLSSNLWRVDGWLQHLFANGFADAKVSKFMKI